MWSRIKFYLAALFVGGTATLGPVAIQKSLEPVKEEVLILRGLTHYDPSGWPAVEMAKALEAQGYKVRIGNHTEGDDLKKLPNILIGHSMGGNAALKAVNRFIEACNDKTKNLNERKACYSRNLPRIVISLDAGKWPLYSHGPQGAAIRCVSLHGGPRLIGGQRVLSNCSNYKMRGVAHGTFPQHPKIIAVVTRIVNEGKPQ